MTDLTRVSSLMVNHTASGVGAVTRRLSAVLGDVINVKDYGAVGDGSTDDTSAVGDAFGAVPTTGGTIYFPAGTYKLSTSLSVADRPIAIVGEGIGVSILQWTAAATTEGISISQDLPTYFTAVRDLSLKTLETTPAGTGLHITLSASNATNDRWTPRVEVSGVQICGSSTANGFNKALRLTNCIHTVISNCHFVGKGNGGSEAANQICASAIEIDGANSPTEIQIDKTWAFFFIDGVKISGTAEGVKLDQCDLVAVGVGVNWQTSADKPQLAVTSSHINAYNYGVYGVNLNQSYISGNLIYKREDSSGDCAGVYISTGEHNVIADNVFHDSNAGGATGVLNAIVLASGSNGNSITGNVVMTAQTGIWLQSGADGNVIRNTKYVNVTTGLLDEGSNNASPVRFCLVGRGNNQTISNNTATAISWENEFTDRGGFFDSGSSTTRLTIPASTGVNTVRITAQVGFEVRVNNTTNCNVYLRKNGSLVDFAGNGIATYVPAGASQPAGAGSMNIVTPPLAVVAGDYFELMYYHSEIDSASAVVYGNTAGKTTWLSIEAVE